MKAIVQHRYGSPDVLEFTDTDQPVPADREVLVRVHAASLNARDWHVLRGDPYVARPSADLGLRRPNVKIRGTDFAGRVEAVGPGVTGVHVGDEVYGDATGAFAEYVVVAEEKVSAKPANLTYEQAAAIPLAATTALVGLRDVANLQPGQQLLINGASGGVGTFAVQLGKAMGAEVTGVCSTRNVELIRSIGADHVVDYTGSDFSRTDHKYDVVLDLVGNRSLTDLRRALVRNGILVLSGGGVFTGGSVFGPIGLILKAKLSAPFVRQRVVLLQPTMNKADLVTLCELAESGKIVPAIDRTYPLSAAADALHYLEAEHARSKVVLTV